MSGQFVEAISLKRQRLIELQADMHTMQLHGSAAKEPCIANGGSPFWFKGCPRVTGAILTGPHSHLYRYCGMTSPKSISDIGNVRHRVDSASTENSSKEVAALPALFLQSILPVSPEVSTSLQSVVSGHV
ncbi:hypothetical protein [Photobacterium galatheae]|uniref:hypothetical protein n=1 Tax=Photobacterium galatheae TaxID=1654360 RepID=UPI001268A366|nr:hypothetical protein [Photobacterium galatheae]MCM0149271.1 hypothetical protein [Photobacterium galatheae]